jgi:outer membrane protein OmpA-like peptidoglycan-associated protein
VVASARGEDKKGVFMATNLLDDLKGLITPQLLGMVSSRLGEPESAISRGMGAALPLVLAGLTQRANEPGALSQIMNLLTSRANTPDIVANPRSIFAGEPSSSGVAEIGSSLVSAIFGTQSNAAISALAGYAGLKNTSSSSLMTLAGTLVAGWLGDRARRDGLSGAGLASLLNSQRDSISQALPGALSSVAGLGTLRDATSRATAAVHDVRRQSSSNWLWAAAAAVVLALGAWALWGNRQATQVATTATDVARRSGQAAGDAARDAGYALTGAAERAGQAASDAARDGGRALANLGSFTTRRLPSNIELSVPERGVESEVIVFLDDPAKQVDPTLWFNFDRLVFETGSARLKPESQEQVKNIAEILKAYPRVKAKIGGYTDNTGEPAANVKLSQDRATNVMTAIAAQGIAPDRLSAEGYGEQFPVADNSTEEGRQQNRRIALRVTEK